MLVKKLLTSIAIMGALSAQAQPQLSISAGLNTKADALASIEAGMRLGPVAYVGLQARGYLGGTFMPAASISPVLGASFSWHNHNYVEHTTTFFFTLDKFIGGTDEFKADPPTPIGFGIRQHIYEGFIEAAYQAHSISFTVGFTFGKNFK
jgi:hypothetical protein